MLVHVAFFVFSFASTFNGAPATADVTKIVEANISTGNFTDIKVALVFILAACIFDLFDGRVARLGGHESPFGREFDSLADMVSFGVAPAFLVYRIVLSDFVRTGWMFAAIYLVCGGIRLARFNVLSQVGNYAESYDRNVGRNSPLKFSRGINALWTQGGAMYVLPLR